MDEKIIEAKKRAIIKRDVRKVLVREIERLECSIDALKKMQNNLPKEIEEETLRLKSIEDLYNNLNNLTIS